MSTETLHEDVMNVTSSGGSSRASSPLSSCQENELLEETIKTVEDDSQAPVCETAEDSRFRDKTLLSTTLTPPCETSQDFRFRDKKWCHKVPVACGALTALTTIDNGAQVTVLGNKLDMKDHQKFPVRLKGAFKEDGITGM